MTKTARKAVAAFVAVVVAWVAFVLNSDPRQITGPELGLLVTNLGAVFITWLTPNDPPVTPAPPVDPLAVEAAWVPQQLPTD